MITRSKKWGLWIPAALLVLPLLGCGYGEVSPAAYEYAQALYSVTNRQSDEGLDRVAEQIQTARDRGELTETEGGWLEDIVKKARGGDWESANSATRRMMEDQLRRSSAS